MLAILRRQRTGEGARVDVSLLGEPARPRSPITRRRISLTGQVPGPPRQPASEPCLLRDLRGGGRPHRVLAVGSEGLWRSFCGSMGEPALCARPALPYERAARLQLTMLRAHLVARGSRRGRWTSGSTDWEARESPAGACARSREALDLPQVAARGFSWTSDHPVAGPAIRGEPHPPERRRTFQPAASPHARTAHGGGACPSGWAGNRRSGGAT